MKWLVWLLLLLNVGLLVYFNLDVLLPKPAIADRSMQPEKLIILSENALAAMPKKALPAPTPEVPMALPATNCYKWGNLTNTNLPAAQLVLVQLGLPSVVNQEVIAQEDSRFWVYYPPLKTERLAQEKAAEIKALGVEEIFIVQDSQWRHAISFGLFQDEQLASALLSGLRAKGVKRATKALRSPGKSLSSLLIKAVTTETALELQKIKPAFVGTDLAPTACE